MKNVFFEMLNDENKNGTTIFFSSHILSEVQDICHRAAIIKNGEITTTENIQSLLKKKMKKVTLVFNQKPKQIKFPEGIQHQHWNGNKLTFEYVGSIENLIQWMSNLDLYDVVLQEPDLESIFMNYY